MFKREFLPSSEESENEHNAPPAALHQQYPDSGSLGSTALKASLPLAPQEKLLPQGRIVNISKNPYMLPLPTQMSRRPKHKPVYIADGIEQITLQESAPDNLTPPNQTRLNCFLANQPDRATPDKAPMPQIEPPRVRQLVLSIVECALTRVKEERRISAKQFIASHIHSFKSLLVSPVQIPLQCTIKRDKAGLSGKLWGKYYLFLDDGWIFLLGAIKRRWNKTSNYMITNKQNNFDKNSPDYLGKVRANFGKTEYLVYNNGRSPKDKRTHVDVRKQIARVYYVRDIQDTNDAGSRAMRGAVANTATQTGTTRFVSAQPLWSKGMGKPGSNCYRVSWNTKGVEESVKNFQLATKDGVLLLEFVKVAEDHYALEIRWPLTPVQAFAIALTSLDKQ